MFKRSLSNLNFLEIRDEKRRPFYGCCQEWYPGEWQQLAGCGPSVASNIIWYLGHFLPPFGVDLSSNSKEKCVRLMQEIWEYVHPTEHGIPETRLFYDAVLAYAKSKGLTLEYRFCDVLPGITSRPGFSEVVDFLDQGLFHNVPVAFLNLCNGGEKKIERWHWVTIVSLNRPKDSYKKVYVHILDGGKIRKIDLSLWFETTTLGGGFVYFYSGPRHSNENISMI